MTSIAPTPLLSVHQLSLYNTGRMSSEQIIAAFAARRQQLDRIVADLASEKPKSRAHHHLIVGQRGMGKTMLLARIAAELRTDPKLSDRFIPLVFAEEQYAVDRLSKFWLNCLDSLADARELAKDTDGVNEIDATVERLTAAGVWAARNDQPFADEVYKAFAQVVRAGGQRPVLLVDNLQIVFERLDNSQQHSLRELLMRPGSPILIGASPSPPPQSQDYGAAFYDQFKVHYLRPLDESEMRALLLQLAEAAGRDDVRQRVLQHPARLTVLRQLTGGNPRTSLTLFFLYAEDFAPSVFGDLEGLLDRVTPLYKARFEELTPQQQVIASAIANHWDPVTAAALVTTTSLPAGTISAQLDRLEKTGVVERTELFGETRTGYQLAERFFNIWFLMRSASRRQRREVEFLTRFLESFYEPADRTRLARQLMREDHFTPDRYVWSRAVAASLEEPETAEELTRHAELTALREEECDARARLREMIDFDSLPPATLAFDDLRKKLMSLVPEDADVTPEGFAEAVLGDRVMFVSGEREQLAAHEGHLSPAEIRSVLKTTQKARAVDKRSYSAVAVHWFSQRLGSGQIRAPQDAEDWNRAFHQAGSKEGIQLMVDSLPNGFGSALTESSLARITSALQPVAETPAWQWFNWAYDLHFKLARFGEGEAAYREAIARDPKDARTWSNLGNLLQEHLKRYTDAEAAYREAIANDQKDAWHWNELGNLLHIHLHCYAEAEIAYREAIARDPNLVQPLIGLGFLLSEHLQRHTEAEAAFREAIARDPKDTQLWNGLGFLLCSLKRYTEAEAAFREAIARDPKDAWPWIGLGFVFKNHLQRYADAETAYRVAIACDPEASDCWNDLGDLLRENMQRYTEAETAYREAIARDSKDGQPWNGLGNLYCDNLDRLSEAAEAYNKALQLDPSDESAIQNRLFLRRDFMAEGRSARPLMDELRTLPQHAYPDTTHLHDALFAAYDSNWGMACEALTKALSIRVEGFVPFNTDDWLRASAVLLHLNYGAELLAFLDQRGDTARLRPWVEALKALQLGDRRALQNIAPEIRDTAEIFYDGIESRLLKLPEKTRRRPLAKPKRTRSKRPLSTAPERSIQSRGSHKPASKEGTPK
jgi:tetratricopeptide (TPR) repeat protein